MGVADTYEQIATSLRTTANTYTTKSSSLQTQSTTLAGVVQSLVTGNDRWAGGGSGSFQNAFSKAQGDNSNIRSALTAASGNMTSLAQTIEDNLPAIRTYESYVNSQSAVPNMPQSVADQFRQAMQTAEQNSATATAAIALMVSSMASQLDAAANQVGVCSTGEKGKGKDGINYADDGQGTDQPPPKKSLGAKFADTPLGRFIGQLLLRLDSFLGGLPGPVNRLITIIGGALNNSMAAIASSGFTSSTITVFVSNIVSMAIATEVVNFLAASGLALTSPGFVFIQSLIGGAIIGLIIAQVIKWIKSISFDGSSAPNPKPQPSPTTTPIVTPTYRPAFPK